MSKHRPAGAKAFLVVACLLGCSEDSGGGVDAGPADVLVLPSPAAGAEAVHMRQCGQCHQSSHPNDGLLSGQTDPVPGSTAYGSNLTPDPDTGMDAWDAATLATAILRGRDDTGKPLCPQMPRYADAGMPAREALDIAMYLQALPAVRHPVPQSTCPPLRPDEP